MKRFLAKLLCVCMVLSFCVIGSGAEGTEVAQIGETKYDTLAEAVAAAAQSGDTIKLLANVTVGTMIMLNKTITLDLNGYKISTTGNDFVQVIGDATLTIDGTKAGSELYGRINVGIATNNNGNVVLNGGTYSCKNAQTVLHINGTCHDSDVTIKNATITSPTDNGSPIIFVNRSYASIRSRIVNFRAVILRRCSISELSYVPNQMFYPGKRIEVWRSIPFKTVPIWRVLSKVIEPKFVI